MTNKIDFLWLRLNALVPEPQCQTKNDDFDSVIWSDVRAKPTADQLLAVDISSVRAVMAENEKSRLDAFG